MTESNRIILPEKYYLDYFHYLLDFVEVHYQHVLDRPEYLFLQSFRNLTDDAQCLYVRLSNRKGDFFRLNKIKYHEISNIRSAKEELLFNGFLTVNQSKEPIQFKLLTKSELCDLFEFLEPSQKKEDILQELSEKDVEKLHESEEILQILKNEEVEFLKLLFFGNRYLEMTEFVIRDVGNIKLEQLDEHNFKPWFSTREEALGVLHLTYLRKIVREIITSGLPLEEYLDELPWSDWLAYPRSKNVAEKFLLEIATHFEKKNQLEIALIYYRKTTKPPSGERQIRILEKLGQNEIAELLAQKLLENPANVSEYTFCKDYLSRSGTRINRSMTQKLKSAKSVNLYKTPFTPVEHLALQHFTEKGWNGIHSENYLWRGLFGLIFWNELFDEQHGAFHYPLQRQPSDLGKKDFFEKRKRSMDERLSSFKSKSGLIDHLEKLFTEKYGTANQFVNWDERLILTGKALAERVPLSSIKKVMLEIAKNTKDNGTGFPDLFIWRQKTYHFYEVKSPNDQLSAQQLFWLEFFASVKIKAEVLKVNYLA